MSSILDSLKKLEKETSQKDYPLTHARAGRKVFTAKSAIGIIGVVCVCIGVIGVAAYYRSIPEKGHEPLLGDVISAPKHETTLNDQKSPLASSQKTPFPLPSTSRNHKSKAITSKSETIFVGGKTITKPALPEDRNNTVEAKTEERQVVELKKAQKVNQVVNKAIQEPEPQLPTKENDKPDSIDDFSKKEFAQEKKPLPMSQLEGVGLKIQAISWGEISEERLVVISNQVLREGDGIEGYQISHINPDDIVLRRGDKLYRLDFGFKNQP